MAIDPLSIPDAAAINYGENDVRHFTEGDAMDVPGISRPTRHLAQRDVAIAQKVNEVIEVVNNKEQFVPMPVLRTTLPPNSEEIIQNFRIPPGFECRVLNAVVTSIPASSSAELDIYYTPNSFGNSTGAQVVSTSTEYTGGTIFFSAGEFIITLKNRGGSTLEMIASILLTMRPLGATSGYLLASASIAPSGPPGPAGPPGPSGGAGPTGPAGSPGLTWQSAWVVSTTYTATDVVYYDGSCFKSKSAGNVGNVPVGGGGDLWWDFVARKGDPGFDWKGVYSPATTYNQDEGVEYLGSSYVCVSALPITNHDPITYPAEWDLIAAKGADGPRYRGNWGNPPTDNPSIPYALSDVVTYVVGGSTQTYVAVLPPTGPIQWTVAPPNTSWNIAFSAPTTAYGFRTCTGTVYVEADYKAASGPDGPYLNIPLSYPGTAIVTFQEYKVSDAAVGHGLAFLKFYYYAKWLGSITLVMPDTLSSSPASVNWTNTDAILSFANAGTVTSYGTQATIPLGGDTNVPGFRLNGTVSGPRLRQFNNKFTITNPSDQYCMVYMSMLAIQAY